MNRRSMQLIFSEITTYTAQNRHNLVRIDTLKTPDETSVPEWGGGKLKQYSDVLIESSETETYLVQEEHIRFYHEFCARVEAAFFEV